MTSESVLHPNRSEPQRIFHGAAGVAAFLCDDRGYVQALTPSGGLLLENGVGLSIEAGVLAAAPGPDLARIIEQVDRTGAARTLLMATASGQALVLDVTPLTVRGAATDGPALVMVSARCRPAPAGDPESVLQGSFDLTAAEAGIALRLARGASRTEIARDRGVSAGTVKTQIKTIYLKVGVTREVELAARLAPLL